MKRSGRVGVKNRKSNKILKIIILLLLFIGVFISSYIFGLKVVEDSKVNEKQNDNINNLLQKAKPNQ